MRKFSLTFFFKCPLAKKFYRQQPSELFGNLFERIEFLVIFEAIQNFDKDIFGVEDEMKLIF